MGALVNPPNSSSRANVSNSQTGAQGVSGIFVGSINTNSGKANITTTNKTPARASGGPSAQKAPWPGAQGGGVRFRG